MDIVDFPGKTRILGEKQGYLPLPVRDVLIEAKASKKTAPAMLTLWRPTEEERRAIADGACIILSILGNVHPPVMLAVDGGVFGKLEGEK